jgi:hypothetical protein
MLIDALETDGERVKAKVRRISAGARFSGSFRTGWRSAAARLRNKLRGSRKVGFSIAARVKPRPDYLMLSPFCTPAD